MRRIKVDRKKEGYSIWRAQHVESGSGGRVPGSYPETGKSQHGYL